MEYMLIFKNNFDKCKKTATRFITYIFDVLWMESILMDIKTTKDIRFESPSWLRLTDEKNDEKPVSKFKQRCLYFQTLFWNIGKWQFISQKLSHCLFSILMAVLHRWTRMNS